jgi:2-polyprenyl-3-methyl-5-hydroxy-6-metoxy-1,4-benzoquinol methylase
VVGENVRLSFVDYYKENGIIPVRQDLTDLDYFSLRRKYLYTTLGVPPSFIRYSDIIEFGPGTGDNAVATSLLGSRSYVFVDANPASIDAVELKRNKGMIHSDKIEIHCSEITQYSDDRKYDLVICEGVIPVQRDPENLLRHVSSFCRSEGVLIVTSMSACSVLSELCRRIVWPYIAAKESDFRKQTIIASDIFRSHIAALKTSTRSVEDWVHDTILHDWTYGRYIFSIKDFLEVIGNDFEFYSSSPRLFVDDRWYKSVDRSSASVNAAVLEQSALWEMLFLDYRLPFCGGILGYSRSCELLGSVRSLVSQICAVHDDIFQSCSYGRLSQFLSLLENLSMLLPSDFEQTKVSIGDFVKVMEKVAEGGGPVFGAFSEWWGRGQQYISFVAKGK